MKDILDKILVKEVVGPILIILISLVVYLVIKSVIDNVFKIRNKYIDKRKSKTINYCKVIDLEIFQIYE